MKSLGFSISIKSIGIVMMMSDNLNNLTSVFGQKHVYMKDPDAVMKKISSLAKDGTSSLQVISDFDKTITKYRHLNKRVPSSHCIIESHSLMPGHIKQELAEMSEKYYAIEIDHTIPREEKIPHMIDWSNTGVELYTKAKVKKSELPQMVAESNVSVRDGFVNLADLLNKHGVPLLVFSAGVGDILEEVLRQQAKLLPNMEVIANFMDFDSEGTLVGLKGELIHSFNKNGSTIEGDSYFGAIKHRHNVILMGDMVGDLSMANNVPNKKTCLKIGFLNSKFEELIGTFMDSWDIVLEDDQTMDIPNAIVQSIMS